MREADITRLSDFCRRDLSLETAKLGDEYGYGSVPLCVIDAVFSIGVRYEGVRNVIARYCDFFGLTWNAPDQQIVQQLLDNYRDLGVDLFTESIYAILDSINGDLSRVTVESITAIVWRG